MNKLKEIFSIDLRTLALFRIAIGLLVIVDIFFRIGDLEAFYTDSGIAPTSLVTTLLTSITQFSFHLINGTYQVQLLIMVFYFLIALSFFFGYKTKTSNLILWLLTISLQARNFTILNGGDIVLKILLFWSLFLPLGACYSLDNALDNSEKKFPKKVFSNGTIALLLQFVIIYVFSALYKSKHEEWLNGTAVFYAFNLDNFVSGIGTYFLGYPKLLTFLTYFVFYFELIGPFIFFLPWKNAFIRMILIIMFSFMHIGFGACFVLGLFPWAMTIALIPFIPSEFWDHILSKLKTKEKLNLKIYYDGECGFCRKMVYIIRTFFLIPETAIEPAQNDENIHEELKKYNSWVVVDSNKNHFYKFNAFIILSKHSPILFIFAPIMKLGFIFSIGTFLYERVANNRVLASKFVSFLKANPNNIQTSNTGNFLALFFLVYIFLWNIDVTFYENKKMPFVFKQLGYAFQLEQSWHMFSPPGSWGSWTIVSGTLNSGKKVNVLREDLPLSLKKPNPPSILYKNWRWLCYFSHVALFTKKPKNMYHYLSKYLCRKWNKTHGIDEKLEELEIYVMYEPTLLDESPELFKEKFKEKFKDFKRKNINAYETLQYKYTCK